MDFESHNSLSVVDESRGTIQISGVRVDNDWLEDIKKLLKIHEYWLSYIFSISYGPNISQPHNPQELEEYEYKLFLTVIDKGS